MREYTYLIIGGGMTADAAVKGIRSRDKSGSIGIMTSDEFEPYRTPPLSKGLWKGETTDSIFLKNAVTHAEIHVSCRAVAIDPRKKQVTDKRGEIYGYQKLLLATGGRMRTLPFDAEGVIYFRTLRDYHILKNAAEKHKRAIVIGGGFIGAEIAAALNMNNLEVSLLFPEAGIGSRLYPAGLSEFLNEFYRSKGVSVFSGQQVAGITKSDEAYLVRTDSGMEIEADIVVAGIGIEPETTLAESARLNTGNGIVVNEYLQTSDPDIYSAGDVANFFNPVLEMRMRVEHEDNALKMGETAGRNMAGAKEAYDHLPFFYTDMFELGYEAVGRLDSRFEIVEDWKDKFREGVLYYLEDQRLRGVLLWNTWDQVDHARALLSGKNRHVAESLKGRLPVR